MLEGVTRNHISSSLTMKFQEIFQIEFLKMLQPLRITTTSAYFTKSPQATTKWLFFCSNFTQSLNETNMDQYSAFIGKHPSRGVPENNH